MHQQQTRSFGPVHTQIYGIKATAAPIRKHDCLVRQETLRQGNLKIGLNQFGQEIGLPHVLRTGQIWTIQHSGLLGAFSYLCLIAGLAVSM